MEPRPERARAPRGPHETPTPPVNTRTDRTSRVGPESGIIPVPGGGPCDICHKRSFRRVASGFRHEDCEPPAYAAQIAMRIAPRQCMTTHTPEWDRTRVRALVSLERGLQL